jgi:predicted cytidylate kinase
MNYRNIVVAGNVGTGTTTLAKALCDKFGFKYVSTGDFFRAYALEHNIELWDKEAVPDEIDRKIDQKFFELMKNEKGYVFDTHYGGYFARDLKDVYKILLTCNEQVAEQRVILRQHTHKETVESIRKRREENQEKFNKLYSPKTPEEPEYFDLIIDTTNISKEETLDKAYQGII